MIKIYAVHSGCTPKHFSGTHYVHETTIAGKLWHYQRSNPCPHRAEHPDLVFLYLPKDIEKPKQVKIICNPIKILSLHIKQEARVPS